MNLTALSKTQVVSKSVAPCRLTVWPDGIRTLSSNVSSNNTASGSGGIREYRVANLEIKDTHVSHGLIEEKSGAMNLVHVFEP